MSYDYSIRFDGKSGIANIVSKYICSLDCNFNNINAVGFDKDDSIIFSLPYGDTFIKYNDEDIKISLLQEDTVVGDSTNACKYETLTIYSKINRKHLENLINDAHNFNLKRGQSKLIVRGLKKGFWSILSTLPKRNLETVYLDNNVRNNIVNDIDEFIKNEELYLKFGIPYKRNILLTGPPGTGKTSLIFAIASYLDMDINIINLGPAIDDYTFMSSISRIDEKSILVLEDIDSLFVERQSTTSNNSTVSFSCILNTLDGVGRKNKLITFLTTNYVDRLDKALLRPGRVDYKVELSFASDYQIREMYTTFLPNQTDKLDEFCKLLKNEKVTTSVLQQFLFRNRNCSNIIKVINELYDLIEDNSDVSYKSLYI